MLLILSVYVIKANKVIVLNTKDIIDLELSLHDKLGKDYFRLYDYTYFETTSKTIVFPKVFSISKSDLPDFGGSAREIIQKSIDYVNSFSYTRLQSNPSKMRKTGEGNCQAMSLLLDSILQKHKLKSLLVIENNHMKNKVYLDEKCYYIDLALGSLLVE